MKNLFFLACAVLISTPAFANDQMSTASDSSQVESLVRPHRPGRPERGAMCIARNTFGREFSARARNERMARWQALRTCESRTRFGSCRIVRCR